MVSAKLDSEYAHHQHENNYLRKTGSWAVEMTWTVKKGAYHNNSSPKLSKCGKIEPNLHSFSCLLCPFLYTNNNKKNISFKSFDQGAVTEKRNRLTIKTDTLIHLDYM